MRNLGIAEGPSYLDSGKHAVGVVNGGETYIFVFTNETKAECLRILGRYASNPEIAFTWYDAAIASLYVRSGISRVCQAVDTTDSYWNNQRDALMKELSAKYRAKMVDEEYWMRMAAFERSVEGKRAAMESYMVQLIRFAG